MMRIPLTIITGPLGSGKTTLLRRLLQTATMRVAVVMNEFGELAIDSKLIEGRNVRIAELAGGCVCCSLTGEFEAAVAELIDAAHPEWILLETTGVAEPEGLVVEVEALEQVRLDGVVVLIDADAALRFPQLGRTAEAQLGWADLVLITKVDLVDEVGLRQVRAKLRSTNARAPLIPTVRGAVDPALIFGLAPARPAVHPVPAPRHPSVDVVAFETDAPVDRQRFEGLVRRLPDAVWRAKGFVHFGDDSALFNYVAGRWEFEPWSAEATRLVFLGPGLSAQRDALLGRLRACEAA